MRYQIKEIMKSVFELSEISDTISTDVCQAWDSLHHLSLIIELENKFNVSFYPEEINKMKSLDSIETILNKKIIK